MEVTLSSSTVDPGLSACQRVPAHHHPISSQCGDQQPISFSQQLLVCFSPSSPQKLQLREREGSSAILLVFLAILPAPPQMTTGMHSRYEAETCMLLWITQLDDRLVSATMRWSVLPWEAPWLATATSNGTKPSVRCCIVAH